MNSVSYFKSPNVLVLRHRSNSGVALADVRSGKVVTTLSVREQQWWHSWSANQDDAREHQDWLAELAGKQLATRTPSVQATSCVSALDHVTTRTANHFIKWYWETPDMAVIFNTSPMARNNPLLILGPYGCLCWRGIVEGWPLAYIRQEAQRIFGVDEVVQFLARLASLGFIEDDGSFVLREGVELVSKEFPAPTVQFQMKQSLIPWYCLWELCTACDLRCKICYQPEFFNDGPSEAEAARLATQFIHSGIFYVCLLGGEPLLRRDLERIIAQLRAGGIFTKIITNGQRLTPQRATSLAHAGLNQIEVSIDGLTFSTHESSRGQGTFQQALDALKHSRNAGIPRRGVVWTIHSGNFSELPALPAFLEEHAIPECYISKFKKTGLYGATALWEPLTQVQLEIARQQIDSWRSSFPHLSIVLLPSCSCGRTSIVIGADGGVRTCSFSYKSVGNVKEDSLSSIWRAMETSLPETGQIGYCSTLIQV